MTIKGTYLPEPTSQIRPFPDPSMAAATVNLTAGQAAAFLLLNDNLQFTDNFPFIAGSADTPDGYSPLGTPVYGRIILGTDSPDGINNYTDAQGNAGSFKTVELDCAVVDAIDFNPKVVVTNIQGLSTSIKEFISSGDNDITITGVFNSSPGVAPTDFISNMNQIFSAPIPIPVTNYYLNLQNIYYIVIMPGTTMGQIRGEYSTQKFTIKAISDTPMTEMLP